MAVGHVPQAFLPFGTIFEMSWKLILPVRDYIDARTNQTITKETLGHCPESVKNYKNHYNKDDCDG